MVLSRFMVQWSFSHFPFLSTMNRRNVLKTLALGAAGLTATTSANAQESSQRRGLFRRQTTPQATSTAARTPALRPLRLGFADIHFSDADPEAWAQHAVDRKLRAVNAPWNIGDGDRIRAIVAAVERRDLVIAEVGRWVNMLADDPAQRAENLQTITDGLAAADELNARCCVCTAGSFSDPVWGGRSPRNVSREYFDYAVENARKIIDAVKPTRTKFTFEPVPWLLPNTADQYLELIRAIDRPEFAVHLDVPNMTNTPEKIWNNTALINEIFDKLR